jgi:hypothetical protein
VDDGLIIERIDEKEESERERARERERYVHTYREGKR